MNTTLGGSIGQPFAPANPLITQLKNEPINPLTNGPGGLRQPPAPANPLITQLKNEFTSVQNTLNQIYELTQKNTGIIGEQAIILSDSERYITNVKSYTALINKELDTTSLSSINTYKKMISDNKSKQATLESIIVAGKNLANTYNDVILSLQRGGINESTARMRVGAAKTSYDMAYAQMKRGGDIINIGAPLVEVRAISNPPRAPRANVSGFSDYSGAAPAWTNSIPSWLICDWYYALFVLNVALLIILGGMYVFASKKKLSGGRLNTLVLSIIFSSVSTLFFYLMCNRSLKPTSY